MWIAGPFSVDAPIHNGPPSSGTRTRLTLPTFTLAEIVGFELCLKDKKSTVGCPSSWASRSAANWTSMYLQVFLPCPNAWLLSKWG